ncbi:hypothetical protein [Achromobacter spanius]|uniref:hypothetical protein n=1 Tax=Achromobacter spanius TaxID=217203 RepID=UPI0038298CCB
MNHISEADLKDMVGNSAVKQMTIQQTKDRKYQILVNLTWKSGDVQLFSTRNAPREWASLDRLVAHIQTNYGLIPKIALVLNPLAVPEPDS